MGIQNRPMQISDHMKSVAPRPDPSGAIPSRPERPRERRSSQDSSSSPIPWVKHWASNAADPCIAGLIETLGFEGYGRYWRLIELLSTAGTHELPNASERGYMRYQLGLKFGSDARGAEECTAFLEALEALDLIERGEGGHYSVPIIEQTAQALMRNRENASKGGRTAAANRRARSH